MTPEQEDDREQYVINNCTPVNGEQAFRDMIDECQESICIGSIEFVPSQVLEELDPTAFRCGMLEYMDGDYVEINEEWYTAQDVLDAEVEWDDEQTEDTDTE